VGAAISFLAAPANFGVEKMKAAPAVFLAVVSSFLLFGSGTGVILMKEQWRASASVRMDQDRLTGDMEGGMVFGEHLA